MESHIGIRIHTDQGVAFKIARGLQPDIFQKFVETNGSSTFFDAKKIRDKNGVLLIKAIGEALKILDFR